MATPHVPPPLVYEPIVRGALVEDLGQGGDITTDLCVPASARASAAFVARQGGRVAGLPMALSAFRMLSSELRFEVEVEDGADIAPGGTIAIVSGPARPILTAERTALNILTRLSGIATATAKAVATIDGTGAAITCTRKTTPGLRALEKYAVRVGGGLNHRFGLDDGVLIKDNHIVAAGGIVEAIDRARAGIGHMRVIEVEVDTLEQLLLALTRPIDAVLLDNMNLSTLREAVTIAGDRVITEASGGVRPETIRAIAETGVDLVSVGWLTHSAPQLDIGLDLELG